MSQCTFTLTSSSGTAFFFPQPLWGNPRNETSQSIKLFNLWDATDIDTADLGINTQECSIGGFILRDATLDTTLSQMNTGINAGDTYEITGLGSCLNGVYIVKTFTISFIDRVVSFVKWELTLEKVRDT